MTDFLDTQDHQSAPTREQWFLEINQIGGTDPLSHFKDNSYGQINLEKAHPGGLAQFVTGRPTLLSNLIRDSLSFSRAYSAANRIKHKQDSLAEQFGIESLYLASGLVDLRSDGHELRMPILLWPVNLLTKQDDFELSLSRKAIVNPALAPALQKHYGVKLNAEDLLSMVQVGSDPIPVRVLDHISSLTDESANLEFSRVLAIGNFSSAASDLASDFQDLEHPVTSLFLSELDSNAESFEQGIADPIAVTDSDSTQTRIVSRALAGTSFAIETLPGCGYTQTVVLLASALAHQGKRVLVLAPRRQTLDELATRFTQVGLPGLGIRASSTWLDMISAISRNEKAQPVNYSELAARRDSAREEVANYFADFEKVDGELGVSIEQALEELARLSGSPRAPINEARIDADQLGRHRDLTFAGTLLSQAQQLGMFEVGPSDSAWFMAKFENPLDVPSKLQLAKSLYENTFQDLSGQLAEFTKTVEFKPALSVDDWVNYLELFVGIRETLDKFKPEVFDRPLTELILATAPRKDKSVMSGANRSRLKKLAKEYLRPGLHVSDMHLSLKAIQLQRDAWGKYCLVAKPPQVPLGIKEAQHALNSFVSELGELQALLSDMTLSAPLTSMPLNDLTKTLRSLSEDTKILDNYDERSMTTQRLEEAGLGPLAVELANLHTSKEDLHAELELAWWKSALETLLERSGRSLAADSDEIVQIEKRFAAAETELIAAGSKTVAYGLSGKWKQALENHPSEAQTLKELLKLKRAVISEVSQLAPHVYQALVPVVLASPYEVPRTLAKGERFDVTLVLDGAGSSIAENYSGLVRSSQVVVFGDDVIAAATGFNIECLPEEDQTVRLPGSIFTAARRSLPLEVLRRSYRTSGQALGDYINREFYQDRIIFEPTAASYFGQSNVKFERVVAGNSDQPESLDQELSMVIQAVMSHATYTPQDSLLVATASPKHAERLETALRTARKTRTDLDPFFESHGREKFEITTIQELAHRVADRIIFSLGFGKDLTGQAPKILGQLSDPSGKRYLANLLVSARKQMTIVSALDNKDLLAKANPGVEMFSDLIHELGRVQPIRLEADLNPMIADLAIRLTKLGVTTRTNFSTRIKLVASVGDKAAIVEPDWGILGYNLSERYRLRPALLEAMGWMYLRVPSFELFADPEQVARSIAMSLGIEVTKKAQPLFELTEPAFEDTASAWGDPGDSNDQRLAEDKPPHWG
jgi:hypothetical protein